MRFGAPVWPFKWEEPYDGTVRRIAGLGFRAVELIGWKPTTLDSYYTDATIKELRATLDGEGVQLSQFVANPGELASGDKAVRAKAVENFKRYADVGAQLGTQIINTVVHYPFGIHYPALVSRPLVQEFTVEVPKDLDWKQNWADYVAAIRACSEYCQSLGLKYSLEMHPFRYGATTEALLRLFEAVDNPALGVNLDPSHTFPLGDITHVSVYRLADRLWHCDFSDNDGETNVHFRPGKGKIDWARTMVALKDVGYDGVVSLEFEDIPGVSRGTQVQAGAYGRNDEASPEVDREYKLALEFLTDLALKAGLKVE
ncbi:MAG TPA: sugar phosphate isomerase/epimerase family protein [Acidimicrobiales bacterium]|nr:sugar phosphate isomerase/epimerase family protein [Acidimicrobiales bacterium]